MQVVREGDTVLSRWIVTDDSTAEPVDLTGSTIEVHVQSTTGGAAITLPSEITDAAAGRIAHSYDTLVPGTYNLEVEIEGPPGIQTSPTKKNALLRVVPQIA